MMKASPSGHLRPRIIFSQTPHSIARRAKRLSNRTAAELLRYLCELTIGFGKGFVDITYRALAKALGREWRTIARAVKFLKDEGDVSVETLHDGSYRWYVLLEPDDILADAEGIYRLKEAAQEASMGDTHHVTDVMTPMTSVSYPHDTDDISPMTPVSWGEAISSEPKKPVNIRVEDSFINAKTEPLKIDLKDNELKIHQQERPLEVTESLAVQRNENDDEPFHKILLRMLQDVGMKQRVARKVVREHDHQLVVQALESVARRCDVKNPAGYVLRELEDGGYDSEWLESPESAHSEVSRTEKKPVKHSDAPIVSRSVFETKAENERLEAQRLEKEKTYREEFKALYVRFQGLTEGLKSKLKTHWTEHLERTLPNTPRKQAMLKEQTFQRMAFKEVTERFFALVDGGLAPDGALVKMGA